MSIGSGGPLLGSGGFFQPSGPRPMARLWLQQRTDHSRGYDSGAGRIFADARAVATYISIVQTCRADRCPNSLQPFYWSKYHASHLWFDNCGRRAYWPGFDRIGLRRAIPELWAKRDQSEQQPDLWCAIADTNPSSPRDFRWHRTRNRVHRSGLSSRATVLRNGERKRRGSEANCAYELIKILQPAKRDLD